MFEEIKESVRDILRPLAKKTTEINPNTLTLFGLLLSLISAYFFARQELYLAGTFLLAGGFLDSVCDRFADAAIIIGAMYAGLTRLDFIQGWLIGSLAIFGSVMVSYTRARAEAAGASASVGPGERSVRIIIIIVGAFFDLVNWAILLVAIISFITVFQRIAFVRKVLK